MFVTTAPCAIKGAVFGWLRGCHREERDIQRETNDCEEEALPLLEMPKCSQVGDRPFVYRHFLSFATSQAPRSIAGSDPVVNAESILHLSRLIDTPFI